MIEMDALTPREAQRKENIDIRTIEIDSGILKARELGYGEWEVEKAGRSFIRVS